MLRFYTLIIASLSCWQLVTAQEQTDSVLVSDTSANNATRHIDNDSSLTDAEKDCHMLSLTDIKKKTKCHLGKRKSKFYFGDFHIGFVQAIDAPKAMDIDMGSSIEVGFTPLTYRWYTRNRKQYFSMGLGVNWRNFRMTGRSRFDKDTNANLIISPYPEEVSEIGSSRIKVFSISVPFTYAFHLGNQWKVGFSATLNFNTFASIETQYRIVDTELVPNETVVHHVKEGDSHIHHQPVSVDFGVLLNWRWLGVYAKYSPCKVLNTDFGPSFTPLTVGFSIGF